MDNVEKKLAEIATRFRKAEQNQNLAESEIGCATCALLREREAVSVADLVQFFNGKIENSESARGKTKAELDLQRILWEAAIKKLSFLRAG